MKRFVLLIAALFCAAGVSAQSKQRFAVLPSVGDMDPQRLILLTDKVREIATQNLPMEDFSILKQDVITKMIGEEELYRACKEGVCIGDLAKKTNANYGARCDVVKLDNSLVLKFELYSVNEEAIFETFTDYNVQDFRGMLAVLDARLPDVFKKMVIAYKGRDMTVSIIPRPLPLPAPTPILPVPQTTPVSEKHAQDTVTPEKKKGLWMAQQGYGVVFRNNFGGEIDLKQTGTIWRTSKYDSIVVTYKKKPYHQGWGASTFFFDFSYVGSSVEFLLGNVTWSVEQERQNASTDSITNFELNTLMMSLEVGVFGKYPIAVSKNMKWFPVAGIYYGWDISDYYEDYENDGGKRAYEYYYEDYIYNLDIAFLNDALAFKFGAGLNVALGETLFLRSEALYNIKIFNPGLFDGAMKYKFDKIKKTGLNHGLTLRVSLGWGKENRIGLP